MAVHSLTDSFASIRSRGALRAAVAVTAVALVTAAGCSSEGAPATATSDPTPSVTATVVATAPQAPPTAEPPSPTPEVTPNGGTPTAPTPGGGLLARGVFASPVYHIEFRYPPEWGPVDGYDERWGGEDGFFQVLALDGDGWTVDDAAKHIASHILQPYGSSPTIESITADGVEARLILPSDDQAPGMQHESALVIPASRPVEINGHAYHFIQIAVDAEHARDIAASLRFIDDAGDVTTR